jgi:hypothetical protein
MYRKYRGTGEYQELEVAVERSVRGRMDKERLLSGLVLVPDSEPEKLLPFPKELLVISTQGCVEHLLC